MRLDRTGILFSCGLILASLAPAASAHRLDIWVQAVDGRIIVEATYSGQAPAVGAEVKITTGVDELLTKGRTDTEGTFTYAPRSCPAVITVEVDDGMGHRARRTITRTELGITNAPANPDSDSELADIRAALTRLENSINTLDARLAHAPAHDDSTFEKTLAGIGFIMGLTGVATFCLSRRRGGNTQ